MNIPIFLSYRLAQASALFFLALFVFHRHSRKTTNLILLGSFIVTGLIDWILGSHFSERIYLSERFSILINVVIIVGTTFLLNMHRDFRALFVGLSAAAYYLAVVVFALLLYYYIKYPAYIILFQLIFSAIVLLILYRDSKKTPLSELLKDNDLVGVLCLIPFICFLAIYSTSLFPGNIFTIPICRLLAVIIMVLMFNFYFLVVTLLRIQSRIIRVNSNNELMKAYASGLKQQVRQMDEAQTDIKIMRHDIRHHAGLIQFYLDSGNTDEVRELVRQINVKLDATVQERYCKNITLNWVLNSAAQKAKRRNIEFQCKADIGDLSSDLELELGTVILNLLENALNAAGQMQEAYVSFTAYPVKEQLFFSVSNPYAGELQFSKETGLPVTDGGEGHGYGLRSVRVFTEKYHATFDIKTDHSVFDVRILVPLKEI